VKGLKEHGKLVDARALKHLHASLMIISRSLIRAQREESFELLDDYCDSKVSLRVMGEGVIVVIANVVHDALYPFGKKI